MPGSSVRCRMPNSVPLLLLTRAYMVKRVQFYSQVAHCNVVLAESVGQHPRCGRSEHRGSVLEWETMCQCLGPSDNSFISTTQDFLFFP